jgi:selenium metabolism protein YedF
METLDLRHLECPQPVLRAKEAIERHPHSVLVALVRQAASCENVRRMARALGAEVETEELENDEYRLTITTPEAIEEPATEPELEPCEVGAGARGRAVVFLRNSELGHGDPKLGRILMKAFLKTLLAVEPLPSTMIFINAGIHLTTEGSEELATLAELAERGVEILSCGTCLDFYKKLDQLRAGRIGNMLDIVTALTRAAKVITP